MKHTAGFTLIELLVGLGISVILTAYAFPNFITARHRSRAQVSMTRIERALAVARQYAIEGNEQVTVCGVDKDKKCDNQSLHDVVVFVDTNDNKTPDKGELILADQGLDAPDYLKLQASLGRNYIRFDTDGSAQEAGSFIYCNAHYPSFAARITISMAGRFYRGRDSNSDGVVEDAQGHAIRC